MLQGLDPELESILANEAKMQATTLRMIPSENYMSAAVRKAVGSVMANRYAEGYPNKRYYQGQCNNDALETLTIERAKSLFGAEHANVQPYSGSPANLAAYLAVCKPGDRVVGLGLNSGGHLTHGWKVNFSGQLFEPHQVEVDPKTERIDYDALNKMCLEVQPRALFIGTTSYSRSFDFEKLSKIAKNCNAVLIVDIAHVAGLVAAGAYPNPVPYADIVTMTTHKSLRGPRGGLILCKENLAKAVDRAVFPGAQGGPHMNQIAGVAAALKEATTQEFHEYAHTVVQNAQKLACELEKHNLRIVSGGTDCHLLVVDLTSRNIGGKTAAMALEKAQIICNFNAIPFDPKPPRNPSGIRLGTPAITTLGFKPNDMHEIANWIVRILENPDNDQVINEVADAVSQTVQSKFATCDFLHFA